MRKRLTILAILAVSAFAACASQDATPEDAGVAEPVIAQTQFIVRFNPAPCDCPPYEIQIGEQWQRVFFEVEDRAEIDALREADPLATLLISARLTDRQRVAENGVRYPVVRDLR